MKSRVWICGSGEAGHVPWLPSKPPTKDDIKQVNATAERCGLTEEERIELGERIHEEKRHDKRDLSWQRLVELCEEVKRDFRGDSEEES